MPRLTLTLQTTITLIPKICTNIVHTKIVFFSSKIQMMKETSNFWIIKIASFWISNPDSMGTKKVYKLDKLFAIHFWNESLELKCVTLCERAAAIWKLFFLGPKRFLAWPLMTLTPFCRNSIFKCLPIQSARQTFQISHFENN